ncbi:hypothetical protein [Marininema halotolerans]|uniref:Uncharacterized protein n=1 Tax=Marininema halotolerans TaxID=1155944 RepID=A0A1I6P978_9BACL|nr:hypothetical protein [Marininema halotolerans]SFS36729.1 hypothetical protein SAMN05444972_101441 [Marininema halotolerans]
MSSEKKEDLTDPWTLVNWGAQLADLKESDNRTRLWIGAILQVLIDKEMVTIQEIEKRMAELEG